MQTRKDIRRDTTSQTQVVASLADREEMILKHLPLVRYIARSVARRIPSYVETDDLYESGIVGLIDAIDKFDPSKMVRFKTYAEYRIRGAILDSLRALDWAPRSLRRKASMIDNAANAIAQRKGSAATYDQVTEYLDMSLDSYYRFGSDSEYLYTVSLESSCWENSEGESTALIDTISDPKQKHPAKGIDYFSLRVKIANEIEKLPEKQRIVLYFYYYKELNMRQIGELMQITESRVSQIHSRALALLRKRLKAILEW
jgi:RNA polymerase sigma factor for flagellar operon FliA